MVGWGGERGVIIQLTDVFCRVRPNIFEQHQSKGTHRGHMICFPTAGVEKAAPPPHDFSLHHAA